MGGELKLRMQSHRNRKPGPSQKHATYVQSEDEYDEVPLTSSRLPKFNFDSSFDYGDAWHSAPPKNRHFVPRYSKLRKAGGKSISFYEKWRKMQYDMNCVMKRYMELISVNLSVLPPCTNYDLWRRPSWRKNYDRPLDEDPCPDCDVRFRFENNEWHAKVAPASILSASRWSKCKYKNSVVMIGLPQHDEKSINNENTPCSKKAEFNGGQEKCSRDSGKSNAIAQTGNFGKMILPDRETVVIDKKTVLSFIQKKKNVDLESHEETDCDLSADEEQQVE